jgi:hypothetical protein
VGEIAAPMRPLPRHGCDRYDRTMFGRLRQLRELLRENEQLRKGLARAKDHIARQRLRIKQLKDGGQGPHGVRAENIVWIFGSGRTGSTWLSQMMGALPDHTTWNEPLVGHLFGHIYYERGKYRKDNPADRHFILGGDRKVWLNSIRSFVLGQATARFPQRIDSGYLVIKEPHGSLGAPLLMEALPESRMVFLVRHPKDVVASALDAHREGSWTQVRRGKREKTLAQERPERFVNSRSRTYLQDIEYVKQAYEIHKGRKVLVRYEDLRADTLGTMQRIYSTLEIPADKGDLAKAVDKYAWENIADKRKGQGKFFRKATPGGWREDLTTEQARIVEEIARPLLQEFYP